MNSEIMKWVKIVVLKTMKEKRLSHLDSEILYSAGLLGYSQSLKRFDPNRGVKFKTFAEYRIKGAVLDEVRKMIGDERCITPRPYKIQDYDFELLSDEGQLLNELDSNIDIKKYFVQMGLDEKEFSLIQCRLDGMNLKEISEYFNISEAKAGQLLSDIKEQIYEWLKSYTGTTVNLSWYKCPVCDHKNQTIEGVTSFQCESCSSDIVIASDGTIFIKEENEYEEELEED